MKPLTPPGELKRVERLVVSLEGRKVGELSHAGARGIYFTYDREWLATGFNLSPLSMTFDDAPRRAQDALFQGLHGPFADSLPDGWGHLLMDRFYNTVYGPGTSRALTPLDRLAYMGDRAMGALTYHPAADHDQLTGHVDIGRLFAASMEVQADDTAAVLTTLRLAGGSPGGARPKAIVSISPDGARAVSAFGAHPVGFVPSIVKFRALDEPWETGRIEHAYALMATQAGVEMASSRLLDVTLDDGSTESLFTTRRFDRDGDRRIHMMTASALLYADFRLPSMDYGDLLKLTDALTRSAGEVEKMARLMVFNALSHNFDDHTKNFSYLWKADDRGAQRWTLSPAYDLTFSTARGEHSTSFVGRGKPTRALIRQLCGEFRYLRADDMIDQTLSVLAQWKDVFASVGIPEHAGEGMFRLVAADHAAFERTAR